MYVKLAITYIGRFYAKKKVFEPVNCSLKYIQKDCILSESEKFYKLLKKNKKA